MNAEDKWMNGGNNIDNMYSNNGDMRTTNKGDMMKKITGEE
jgi:hypothetical protein